MSPQKLRSKERITCAKFQKIWSKNSTTFGLGFAGTGVQFYTSVPHESVSFTQKRQFDKKGLYKRPKRFLLRQKMLHFHTYEMAESLINSIVKLTLKNLVISLFVIKNLFINVLMNIS